MSGKLREELQELYERGDGQVLADRLVQELESLEARMDAKYARPSWFYPVTALLLGAIAVFLGTIALREDRPASRGPWPVDQASAVKAPVGSVVIPPPNNPRLLERLEQGLTPTCEGLKTTDMAWLMVQFPGGGGIDGNGDEVACQ